MSWCPPRWWRLFLSTPSARRATVSLSNRCPTWEISIHALREEGDRCAIGVDDVVRIFLSTPSARRATSAARSRGCRRSHFYPRPPRGGRQRILRHRFVVQDISIHALREEGDPHQNECACGLPEFLSTPSARRATRGNSGWPYPV